MTTPAPNRRKTEKAILDRAGVPVQLLYDEDNDVTIMQRGTDEGSGNVAITGGTIDEVTNVTSVDTVDTVSQANIFAYDNNDGVFNRLRLDSSTSSIQTMGYSHHENHEKSLFSMFRSDSLASGDVIQLAWTTPASAKEPHLIYEFYGSGAVTFGIYEDVTLTSGGTSFTPTCHNRRRALGASICTCLTGSDGVLTDPIVWSGGTTLHFESTGAGKSNPGAGGRSQEWIWEQDMNYVMELTAVGNGISCSVTGVWYEHTPHAAPA